MGSPGRSGDGAPGALPTPEVQIVDAAALPAVVAAWLVAEIGQAVALRGECAIGLAGGTTPRRIYELLASPDWRSQVPWAQVHVYFGDERAVPPDHADSNYRMAREALLAAVPIPEAQVHRMAGDAPDLDAAARAYEAVLPASLDIVLLGIGADGHTASLFPGSPALQAGTRRVLAAPGPNGAPRLTVSPAVLAAARRVAVIATGADKAAAVAQALDGSPDTAAIPARLVRGATWFLDDAAAARVQRLAHWGNVVLAADVGGTNARVALVDTTGGAMRFLVEKTYPSRDYPGMSEILLRFAKEVGDLPSRACIAIAGPVIGDECRATNLPWSLSARQIARDIGVLDTHLINDFSAIGHGIPHLTPKDLVTLQAGTPETHAPIAVIGAGTGLGHGFITWDGQRHRVFPSEGGHVDYAAQTPLQFRLSQHFRSRYGSASAERVVSGMGLVETYRFIASERRAEVSAAVEAEMETTDPAAVITKHGLAETDALCRATVELFVQSYGVVAGNFALSLLAKGGVYLAGGVTPRLLPLLQGPLFLDAFRAKGRMTGLLSVMPVHVVMNTNVGLIGAAAAGISF